MVFPHFSSIIHNIAQCERNNWKLFGKTSAAQMRVPMILSRNEIFPLISFTLSQFFRLRCIRCILRCERRALEFNPFVSFFVMIEPIWSERVLAYVNRVIMMFNFNVISPCLVHCSSHCCFLSSSAFIQSQKENDELFYVRLRIVVVCTQKFLSFVCMWSWEQMQICEY